MRLCRNLIQKRAMSNVKQLQIEISLSRCLIMSKKTFDNNNRSQL